MAAMAVQELNLESNLGRIGSTGAAIGGGGEGAGDGGWRAAEWSQTGR